MGKQKTPNASRKHNPARLVTLQMSQQALELRAAGMSYPQIAARLGFKSHVSAIKAVQRCLDLTLGPVSEDVRTLELERLDRLLQVWWPRAVAGVPVRHPESGAVVMTIDPTTDAAAPLLDLDAKALASVLAILDRRYRLHGLDRAQQAGAENPREVILGILRQVVTEDDDGTRQETRLAVASWRPADVDGEHVVVDGLPPRLDRQTAEGLPPPPYPGTGQAPGVEAWDATEAASSADTSQSLDNPSTPKEDGPL